ncbi:MAG: hypothetical protein ACFCVD_10125 [Nodosilinea sp.]
MKIRMLFLGLFSLSAVAPLATVLAGPGLATGCIAVDLSNQVALHGSPDGVSQNNETTMEATPDCFGSVSVDVGNQIYTGSGDGLVQERESHHYLDGVNNPTPYGDEYLPYGGPDIYIPVETQTQIYVPPFDPNFYDSFLGDPISSFGLYAFQ